MGEIRIEDIEPVRLSKIHNLSKFDCGDEDINDFLKSDALDHQEQKIAYTTLFIHKRDDSILGYCSLAADAIVLSPEEKIENIADIGAMKRYPQYPAIKLARFGRDARYREQRIGKEVIIPWVIGYIENLKKVAVRFLTIDSYPERVEYYKELGFVVNEHSRYKRKKPEQPVSMRFDLKTPR